MARKTGGKRETIRIEFHVRVKHSPRIELSPKLLRAMVQQWVDTGISPSGVEVEAITWTRNHKSRTASGAEGDLDQARVNLRGLINAGTWGITAKMGAGGGVRGGG